VVGNNIVSWGSVVSLSWVVLGASGVSLTNNSSVVKSSDVVVNEGKVVVDSCNVDGGVMVDLGDVVNGNRVDVVERDVVRLDAGVLLLVDWHIVRGWLLGSATTLMNLGVVFLLTKTVGNLMMDMRSAVFGMVWLVVKIVVSLTLVVLIVEVVLSERVVAMRMSSSSVARSTVIS
jgi:hypothetical protein